MTCAPMNKFSCRGPFILKINTFAFDLLLHVILPPSLCPICLETPAWIYKEGPAQSRERYPLDRYLTLVPTVLLDLPVLLIPYSHLYMY